MAILRLVDVTDDTVSIQKTLLDDLKRTTPIMKLSATGSDISDRYPPLINIAMNRYGYKFLLRLLNPTIRHLEPDEEVFFATTPITSKKPASLRRKEYLTFLKNPLLTVISQYSELLLRSRYGCKILEEVCFVFNHEQVWQGAVGALIGRAPEHLEEEEEEDDDEINPINKSMERGSDSDDSSDEEEEGEEEGTIKVTPKEKELLQTVADASDGDDVINTGTNNEEKEQEQEQLPIAEDPIVGSCLKGIFSREASLQTSSSELDTSLWTTNGDEKDPPRTTFAVSLYQALCEEDLLQRWLKTNRSTFILAHMATVTDCLAMMEKHMKTSKYSKMFKQAVDTCAGGKVLQNALNKTCGSNDHEEKTTSSKSKTKSTVKHIEKDVKSKSNAQTVNKAPVGKASPAMTRGKKARKAADALQSLESNTDSGKRSKRK